MWEGCGTARTVLNFLPKLTDRYYYYYYYQRWWYLCLCLPVRGCNEQFVVSD